MRVRIRESWKDSGSVQVDHTRRCVREHSRFRVGADKEHTSSPNGERGNDGTRVVDGVDPAVGENEIGWALRCEHRWCERGKGKVG